MFYKLIFPSLQMELSENHSYIPDFLQVCQFPDHAVEGLQFHINPNRRPQNEHARRYNLSLKEVSVLKDSESNADAGFVLRKRGGGLTTISETHRSKDPLHFVLFFPHGTDGWHNQLKQKYVFDISN